MAALFARRRSPLAPRLSALGAAFVPFADDVALVETLPAYHREVGKRHREHITPLLLCDLSPLARVGVKGRGGESLLRHSALVSAKEVNESVEQKDGALCVRLAGNEVLLLSALDSQGTHDFVPLRKNLAASRSKQQVFPVAYQDSLCWLALAGDRASDLLATMCAVDLRDGVFAHGGLAQTSLARLSALVLRDPVRRSSTISSDVPLFHLLVDSASSLYLWDCLRDAMGEHEGLVCGRQDLLRFLATTSPSRSPSRTPPRHSASPFSGTRATPSKKKPRR